jgi:hypothetical protein
MSNLRAESYGSIQGDSWFVMNTYQPLGLGSLFGIYPDEVFDTWKFSE